MEEIKLVNEEKILTENFQGNIEELKIMSSFYSNFINNIKNLTHFDNTKFKFKRGNNKNIFNSVLFDNIESMYDSFQTFIKNIKNVSNKIQNYLIKQIELFIDEQSKIYQNITKNIKQLIKKYNENKMISKNYEHIYKYEINRFNSFILNNNNYYDEIKKKY